MSDKQNVHDIPRFEPWLGVMTASLVPVTASVYLPSFLIPLIAASVALFVAGLVMLRRSSRRERS